MTIEKILNRLPSHFNKSIDSNNYKALSLVADAIDDSEKLYEAILKFWDVDQAEGYGLDRLGKDEGISRGSYDDETYRKMIKVQFIVNMSEGSIESLNAIFKAYMGDGFLGIEEGWEHHNEPASIFVNLRPSKVQFPRELARRVKSAGVRLQPVIELYRSLIIITDDSYSYPVYYPEAGEFSGEKNFSQSDIGDVVLSNDAYDYEVEYPVVEKEFSQIDLKPVELKGGTYNYIKEYPVAGDMDPLTKEVTTLQGESLVSASPYEYNVTYPVCGEFYAEGD